MAGKRETGFVVLCDIVGFSGKKDFAQKDCVVHLHEAVNASRLFSHHLAVERDRRVLSCTGDGFVLMTTASSVTSHPECLLEFVRDILAQIREWNLKIQGRDADLQYDVRLGIHVGWFYMDVHVFGSPNAIGPGVNIAARVAGVGDAGHVLVSSDVVEALRQTGDSEDFNNTGRTALLARAGQSDGWTVAVKHGVELTLFPWNVDQDGALGRLDQPKKIQQFVAAQDQMLDVLKLVKQLLEDLLKSRRSGRKSSNAFALRLTVLMVRNRRLICTPIRIGVGANAGKTSETSYPVEGELWGMPAHIFTKNQFHVHSDLPEWIEGETRKARASQEAYVKEIREHWGTPEGTIRNLGRKARSYFGVPIVGIGTGPIGVLMVDSADPLLGVTGPMHGDIGETLAFAASTVAPLLHIRYSP